MISCPVVSDSAALWTVAWQTALSMGFVSQNEWGGLPFPPPGNLSNTETETTSPALQVD